MLIAALVMAAIGLAALVTAVVTGNEVIAWACIAASAIGVILLIIDAVRERQRREAAPATEREDHLEEETAEPDSDSEPDTQQFDAEYPDETARDKDGTETVDTTKDSDR